ncbi:MAG: hypothetical protein EBU90_10250 [Proteobacteria bacterium]|nr:hypothetical protein [Pseudomonadota bacterium]NBP13790.1 hypothetical protein [bacterium]
MLSSLGEKCTKTNHSVLALCVYCACMLLHRGQTLTQVSSWFKVSDKSVLALFEKVSSAWSSTVWYKTLMSLVVEKTDVLSRHIFELDCVPHNLKHRVVNYSKQVYNQIHTKFQGIRTKTLNAVCVHIACTVLEVNVPIKDFCIEMCVSESTLLKTLKSVQKALRNDDTQKNVLKK